MIKEIAVEKDIKEAIEEVKSKDKKTIEKETANKWANRAIACLIIAKENKKDRLKWADLADDFRHEAMEHSALADDDGKTLKEVVDKIATYLK
jgi:hypothetical protein